MSVIMYNTSSRSLNNAISGDNCHVDSNSKDGTLPPVIGTPPKQPNLTIERNFASPVILSDLHHLFSCRCTLRSVKAYCPVSCALRLFDGCWRF